jgi:DNA-directed RNA polymerase alpha subunit
LLKQTPNDLLRISSMGRKTLIEIQEALAAHGLKLRDPRNGNP